MENQETNQTSQQENVSLAFERHPNTADQNTSLRAMSPLKLADLINQLYIK